MRFPKTLYVVREDGTDDDSWLLALEQVGVDEADKTVAIYTLTDTATVNVTVDVQIKQKEKKR